MDEQHGRYLGGVLGIGDALTDAVAVELPAVERALDAIALHHATSSKIGAKMRTVRIDHTHLALFRAEDGKIHAENVRLSHTYKIATRTHVRIVQRPLITHTHTR